ncbi:MAG: hypothetical protein ACLQU2_14465 [Candidatus Binataceae bacterium]
MINEPQGDSDKSPGSKMTRNGGSRFGLLWDSEVEALKPLLSLIVGGIDQVLDNWYADYAAYLGNAPYPFQA